MLKLRRLLEGCIALLVNGDLVQITQRFSILSLLAILIMFLSLTVVAQIPVSMIDQNLVYRDMPMWKLVWLGKKR